MASKVLIWYLSRTIIARFFRLRCTMLCRVSMLVTHSICSGLRTPFLPSRWAFKIRKFRLRHLAMSWCWVQSLTPVRLKTSVGDSHSCLSLLIVPNLRKITRACSS